MPKTASSSKTSARSTPYQTRTKSLADKNDHLEIVNKFFEIEVNRLVEENEELEEKNEDLEEKNEELEDKIEELKDEVSRLAYGNYCLAGQNGL